MNKSELNVRIRRLFESGESDPHVVAAQLLDGLDSKDYRKVLSITLPAYTRVLAGRQRRVTDGMAKPVFVPSSGWKDMSDLTSDDCLEIAAAYRKLAEQNTAKAEEFEDWARLLQDTHATTLGELASFKKYMATRTREGMARAKAAGRHVGRPVTEEEIAIKLRIIEMSATMSYNEIVDTLNAEGIKNRDGQPWTYNAVYKTINKNA